MSSNVKVYECMQCGIKCLEVLNWGRGRVCNSCWQVLSSPTGRFSTQPPIQDISRVRRSAVVPSVNIQNRKLRLEK